MTGRGSRKLLWFTSSTDWLLEIHVLYAENIGKIALFGLLSELCINQYNWS